MKVYLSEYIAPSALKRLKETCEVVDTFDQIEEIDGIITRRTQITQEIIEKATHLKVICQHGVGLDYIDVKTAQKHDIPVLNVPGQSAESVAELAVCFIMAISRKLKYVDQGMQKGLFEAFGDSRLIGHEIYGQKLGLVGSGNIAKRVAEMMKAAFHCDIYCYNPRRSKEELANLGLKKVETLQALFHDMDIVSIHIPLTPDTENLISEEVFKNANPNLLLVNTARGSIVNEKALYKALTEGQIAAAASDVFDVEVPDKDYPLLHLDNFISTLHVGGSTKEALDRVSNKALDNLFSILLK